MLLETFKTGKDCYGCLKERQKRERLKTYHQVFFNGNPKNSLGINPVQLSEMPGSMNVTGSRKKVDT